MGLASILTGCGLLRPGTQTVEDAIASAPTVTGADINFGPGGGLGTQISGNITLSASADELHNAFDDAWGRGVEVLYRVYDGKRGVLVADVVGRNLEEVTVSSRDLVELGASKHPTLGHFYDHYGIS